MTETSDLINRHMTDVVKSLARTQRRRGYAVVAIKLCAGSPLEADIVVSPDVDLERINVLATRTSTHDLAAAYAHRNRLDRGVVEVRVYVVLCGVPAGPDEEYVAQVHASSLAVRYLDVPPASARQPFSVVQGGRA